MQPRSVVKIGPQTWMFNTGTSNANRPCQIHWQEIANTSLLNLHFCWNVPCQLHIKRIPNISHDRSTQCLLGVCASDCVLHAHLYTRELVDNTTDGGTLCKAMLFWQSSEEHSLPKINTRQMTVLCVLETSPPQPMTEIMPSRLYSNIRLFKHYTRSQRKKTKSTAIYK